MECTNINFRCPNDVYERIDQVRAELGWSRTIFCREAVNAFLLGIPESVDQMAKNLHNVARNPRGQKADRGNK